MENCVALSLDKIWYIIRSCIVFSQSIPTPVHDLTVNATQAQNF